MFRAISLTIVCLILAPVNSVDAQGTAAKKPFKNKTARAARKSYEASLAEAKALVAKAKKEYAAQLEIAIKEAGGAGDLEDANKLSAEKKGIEKGESDPISALRRRLSGTKWSNAPKTWTRFDANNVGTSHDGQRSFWVVTTGKTMVLQARRSLNIYVWHFDDNLKTAVMHQFIRSKKMFTTRRIR